MNHKLPSTQAFWLGHLHHAFSLGQPLSLYAHEQGLCFAGLMAWRQRLIVQRIVVHDVADDQKHAITTALSDPGQ